MNALNIKRLVRDVKDIMKSPLHDNGIYYIHDDKDMLSGYALIIGPENTPYFGGYYFFSFTFPETYPYLPPIVKYCTNGQNVRFNPNLYTNGKVCVSILNTWEGEQWTSCETIRSVLLHMFGLFTATPLLNEPGVTETDKDLVPYSTVVEYKNIEIAICSLLLKTTNYYLPFFDLFYSVMCEVFNKNLEKLSAIVDDLLVRNNIHSMVRVEMYSMYYTLNYKQLRKMLDECVEELHSKSRETFKENKVEVLTK